MALQAFNDKHDSAEKVQELLTELTTNLRWLLLSQYKVAEVDAAGLADEGLVVEQMWRHLGDSRGEVLQCFTDTLSLPGDNPHRRKLRLQLLCVWTACKSADESQHRRAAQATAMGISMPMDPNKAEIAIEKAINSMPGKISLQEQHPTASYMGYLENMVKLCRLKAEALKKVILEGDEGHTRPALRGTNTSLDGVPITLEEEVASPATRDAYEWSILGMGLAWKALGLEYPNLAVLRDLNTESFIAYGRYVVGPAVALLKRADGLMLTFNTDVLDAEWEVRKNWWVQIKDTQCTLNTAILNSIGVNTKKERSPLWTALIVEKLLMAPLGGKATGKGARQTNNGGLANAGTPGRVMPAGQGKKALKRAAIAAGLGKGGAAATSYAKGGLKGAAAPKGGGKKGPKGAKNKGKAAGKGGKGVPPAFAGKQLYCTTHTLPMCFDHHISGCRFGAACSMCHACCPELGCTTDCTAGTHGVWSH